MSDFLRGLLEQRRATWNERHGDAPIQRMLEDGCASCNYSEVYCSCVLWIDGLPCCDNCSHKRK